MTFLRDAQSLIALLFGRAFAVAAGLLVSVVIGRTLGPDALGRWTLLVAAATMLHTLLLNWTHASTVRFGVEEWSAHHSLSQTLSARLPFLVGGGMAIGTLLWLQPFEWLERGFGLASGTAGVVGLYVGALWIVAECQATLQATGRIPLQAMVGVVASACMVGAVVLMGARNGSIPQFGIAVALALGLPWLTVWLAVLARAQTRLAAPPVADVRRHLLYAAPLSAGFAVGYLSDWGDHLLLGSFATTVDLGQFGLAYQVFVSIMAAHGLLSTVVLPRLINLEMRAPGTSQRYVAEAVPALLVAWALATQVAVVVLPGLLPVAAGSDFEAAAATLRLLGVVVPSAAVTSLYSVLFSVQGRLGRLVVYLALMTATNLCLSVLLIPSFGAAGAAAGTVASYLFGQIVYMTDQHWYLDMRLDRVLPVWLTAVFSGMLQAPPELPWLFRLASCGVGLTAIIVAARRFESVSPKLMDDCFGTRPGAAGNFVRRLLIA
ncbi:MAG: lipopolysaccharide biosynthesis protein [Vicinamibacterales bacterium]